MDVCDLRLHAHAGLYRGLRDLSCGGRVGRRLARLWRSPARRGDLLRPSDCLCDDLSEFDQVAGRVCEKGKLAADGVELERLGHDLDTTSFEVGDGLLDIRHIDAEVV